MRKISLIAAAVAMTASSVYADIQIGKGLNVGGYLDMTYQNVSNDLPAGTDYSGFSAVNAEVDFKMDFTKGLTARVDLDSTSVFDAYNRTYGNTGNGTSFEQVRIDYAFGDSTLTLGKFDTFVGLEALESPELFQISKSYTSELTPTQHTGASYMYNGGVWNAAVALANGYTVENGNNVGDNEDLSYVLHVGIKPVKAFSMNANYAIENRSKSTSSAIVNAAIPKATVKPATFGTGDNDSDIWTIDATYSNHGWTVGAEYVNAETESTGGDIDTDAWMLMVNYMFTEQFGLTARYSVSETDQVTNLVDKDEYAIAASYAFTPNWSGLVEYRVEEDDNTTNRTIDQNTIALETILTF